MIETFKDLEKACQSPLTQQNPAKMLRLLQYCQDYIRRCQEGGSTTFDEHVQRLNGFVPLGELTQETTD